MTTWDALVDRLRRAERLCGYSTDSVTVERGEVELEVALRRDGIRPAVLVTVEVCRADELDPWAALHVNARLERGALAAHGGRFRLRHVHGLDELGDGELRHTLDILAAAAAAIRQELRVPAPDGDCYQAYAD